MAAYKRLTLAERYQIQALRRSGLSERQIARQLKRANSTISRELRRNLTRGYDAKRAQKLTRLRRAEVARPLKIRGKLRQKIVKLLRRKWSPEQISAHLNFEVCAETIYLFIYRERLKGIELYVDLRRRRKFRRSRKAGKGFARCGFRVGQRKFKKRPKIVKKRKRIGDWERDTMLGKKGTPVLLTMVDRVSKLTKLSLLESLNSELTHKATVRLLQNQVIETMTNDNGPEFSLHKKTEKKLGAKIYFNDPYCSWQRGTNENTNGLIRQYFPKGFDFSTVNDRDIKRVERALNSRPRKSLRYKTPFEVHKRLSQGVALSS